MQIVSLTLTLCIQINRDALSQDDPIAVCAVQLARSLNYQYTQVLILSP